MSEWLDRLLKTEFYEQLLTDFVPQQVGVILLVILLAFLSRRLLNRIYPPIRARIPQKWIKNIVQIIIGASRPVFAFIYLRLADTLLASFELQTGVLDWAFNLAVVWFYYKLLTSVLELNLKKRQFDFWYKHLFIPVFVVVVVLAAFDLLDVVLSWGVEIGKDGTRITVQSIMFGIAFIAIFYIVGKTFRGFLNDTVMPQTGAEPSVSHGISTLTYYLVLVLGVTIALTTMGVNLTSLAVIAGGLSVGLGFGLQEIVNNFVSGFILLFEKSVGPGDVIKIGEITGTVQSIGIRAIQVTTRDNIELIVPNSHYLSGIVTNLTRSSDHVRLRVSVGVTYSADPETVQKVLLEIAHHDLILNDPAPEVWFTDFGESSLNFDLMMWTAEPESIPRISSDMRYKIFKALKEADIEIPFPQRDLHIRSDATKPSVKDS